MVDYVASIALIVILIAAILGIVKIVKKNNNENVEELALKIFDIKMKGDPSEYTSIALSEAKKEAENFYKNLK